MSVSSKLTDTMVRQGIVEEEDREVYEYGIKSMIMSIIPVFFGVVFGFLVGKAIEGIIMIATFAIIRKYAGGYHLKSGAVCLFASIVIIAVLILLGLIIENKTMIAVVLVLSASVLFAFSPIDNENRRLEDEEKKHCRRITRLLVPVIVIAYVFFTGLRMNSNAVYLTEGMALAAFSQILSKLEKFELS